MDAMLALVGQDTSSWAAVDRIRQWIDRLATQGNAVATFQVDQQIVPFPRPPCPGSDASQGPIHFDLAAGDADADSFSHDSPDLELMFDDMSLAYPDEKAGAALTITRPSGVSGKILIPLGLVADAATTVAFAGEGRDSQNFHVQCASGHEELLADTALSTIASFASSSPSIYTSIKVLHTRGLLLARLQEWDWECEIFPRPLDTG